MNKTRTIIMEQLFVIKIFISGGICLISDARPGKDAKETKVKSLPAAIIGSVLIACAITAIAIIGCAILLTYTSLTENMLPFVITVSCAVSAIVAGFDVARAVENRGWLWGMVAGAVFSLILIAIEIWISGSVSFDARTITLLVLSLAGGGLGGILGINFKK